MSLRHAAWLAVPLLLVGCGDRSAVNPMLRASTALTDADFLSIGTAGSALPECQDGGAQGVAMNGCINKVLQQIDTDWAAVMAAEAPRSDCADLAPLRQIGVDAAGQVVPQSSALARAACPPKSSSGPAAEDNVPATCAAAALQAESAVLRVEDAPDVAAGAPAADPKMQPAELQRLLTDAATARDAFSGSSGHPDNWARLFADVLKAAPTSANIGSAMRNATAAQMVTGHAKACLAIIDRVKKDSPNPYHSLAEAAVDLHALALAGGPSQALAVLTRQMPDKN